ANSLTTKEAKTGYVFEALSAHAQQTQAKAIATLKAHNATYRSYWIANYIVANGSSSAIAAVAALSDVERIAANPTVSNKLPTAETSRTPNTPAAATWGITHINADDVWQTLNITGTGVIIAGQDTGYKWDHEALKDSYRGWDGVSADHNYNWHDSIHSNGGVNTCGFDSPEPCDDFGHGTHTMGTMVGGNQSGTDIGVAPGAQWIACRNMDVGNGTPSTYLECFQWFLAPTNLADASPNPALAPHVINNSWSCPTSEGCTTANFNLLQTAIENLTAAGVLVVASASNNGNNCAVVRTPPAMYDAAFAVGSFASGGNISSFSSFGPVTVDGSNRMKPDIAAPGSSVFSSTLTGYGNSSGTSMAGPHVAGVVALMISANPSLAGNVTQIKQMLRDSAVPRTQTANCGTDTNSSIPNNVFGHGEVDALAAVQAALDFSPTAAELTQTSTTTATNNLLIITLVLVTMLGISGIVTRQEKK
ncbi:MAG TPA: hypothetical protein ENJ56_00510, partial [Anaerolineae bacterium]|nr:hypothetical protein [Anaerolineae bacterium]